MRKQMTEGEQVTAELTQIKELSLTAGYPALVLLGWKCL